LPRCSAGARQTYSAGQRLGWSFDADGAQSRRHLGDDRGRDAAGLEQDQIQTATKSGLKTAISENGTKRRSDYSESLRLGMSGSATALPTMRESSVCSHHSRLDQRLYRLPIAAVEWHNRPHRFIRSPMSVAGQTRKSSRRAQRVRFTPSSRQQRGRHPSANLLLGRPDYHRPKG
jgi:hypothetical protein